VVLIGPNENDFAHNFSKHYSCRVTDVITIPGQHVVEGRNLKEPLYPNLYQQTLTEVHQLDVKGKLCLVGAGLAGKVFCSKIAAMGGVALDVGSMMDAWAGKKARKYHDETFLNKVAVS
jgi:hypothetical protein